MHITLFKKILISVGFYETTHPFLEKLTYVKSPHFRMHIHNYGIFFHFGATKDLIALSQKTVSESEVAFRAGYETAKKEVLMSMLLGSEGFKGGKA